MNKDAPTPLTGKEEEEEEDAFHEDEPLMENNVLDHPEELKKRKKESLKAMDIGSSIDENDDGDKDGSVRFGVNRRTNVFFVFVSLVLVYVIVHGIRKEHNKSKDSTNTNNSHHINYNSGNHNNSMGLPNDLYGTVYREQDFENPLGIAPPYWNADDRAAATGSNASSLSLPFFENVKNANQARINNLETWGPCYAITDRYVDWKTEIQKANDGGKTPLHYHKSDVRSDLKGQIQPWKLQGYCRPGFLIIGQGKCGTSSLYHYLVDGHPRMLPASEKQIHYFKYYKQMPLKWYYQHFPAADSFLANGALMTGEASPGYIPYPEVPYTIADYLPLPEQRPKIILIGRDPIDRSYSSYRYNYVNPLLLKLRSGSISGAPRGLSDEEYKEKYVFSFEDMVRAELQTLRECFKPGGIGSKGAKDQWYKKSKYYRQEYDKRERTGKRPLIDLDGFCYGPKLTPKSNDNTGALKKQWIQLKQQHPEKVITQQNVHLTQAMLGRSLYLFPLEWWYAVFPADQIYFMCTEELQDMSGEPLNQLSLFLGLPRYEHFDRVVQQGVFNAGGFKGYDKEVSWEQLNNQKDKMYKHENHTVTGGTTGNPTSETTTTKEVPLSKELLQELRDFFHPYNEELFALTGRRCSWDY